MQLYSVYGNRKQNLKILLILQFVCLVILNDGYFAGVVVVN